MTEKKNSKKAEVEVKDQQTADPKAEAKAEAKAEPKRKLTPKKKVTSDKGKAEAKAEESKAEAKAEAKAEPKAEAAPVREIPPMPASFCLTEQAWNSDRMDLFSPESGECKECVDKFPDCYKACREREEILKSRKAGGKKKRTAKAKAEGDPAKRPQSIKIDDLIRAEITKDEAVTTLAAEEFEGNEKRAGQRIDSHIKAIKTGTYCRAEAMKPFLESAGW